MAEVSGYQKIYEQCERDALSPDEAHAVLMKYRLRIYDLVLCLGSHSGQQEADCLCRKTLTELEPELMRQIG